MSFPPLRSIDIEDLRANYLPYQTTSQQAMETLADGVGFGRPRHQYRSNTTTSALQRLKKKKSLRFGCLQCGGDATLYDDGLNTSFAASTSPSEKVKGRIKVGASSQVTLPPPMPSVEFLNYRPQSLDRPLHHTVRTQAPSRLNDQESSSIVNYQLPPTAQLSPIAQAAPNGTQTGDVKSTAKATKAHSDYRIDGESLPPTVASSKLQNLVAIRAKDPETNATDEGDQENPTQIAIFERATDRASAAHKGGDAADQLLTGTMRPSTSSSALVCETLLPRLRRVEDGDRTNAAQSKKKRRGGFISMTSSDVLVSAKDEPAVEETMASSSVNGSDRSMHSFSRSSLASSLSKYSTASPYLDLKTIPSRATMGGANESPALLQHGESHQDQQYEDCTYDEEANATNRGSATTTCRTVSVMASPSIQGSEQSPAIGDVLSHFPTLIGRVDDGFASSPCHSSESDGDNIPITSRINTFGTNRDLIYDESTSPARISQEGGNLLWVSFAWQPGCSPSLR
ncbi:hypothetical protein CBS101457_005505 [Exobasidium rhododendri]|nr:hypothetical protein CBS101457_005505 [Exobasidium rhododendri]